MSEVSFQLSADQVTCDDTAAFAVDIHHVHHLNPRVPNYRLAEAHHAVQSLRPVVPLSLGRGLTASFLTLWDEQRGRLVRFRDASRLSTAGDEV